MLLVECSTDTSNSSSKKDDEISNIKLSFTEFKTALSRGNGSTCSNLVSQATINYYYSLLDMVLTADSSKLVISSLLERFTVLAIRQSVDWNRLRAMNGSELFSYAIESGMIGKDFNKLNLGDLKFINNDLVSAELVVNGKNINKRINFYKEKEKWCVDLIEILKENETNLKIMVSNLDKNEHNGLLLLFEKTFGNKPSKEIWLPVKWYNK